MSWAPDCSRLAAADMGGVVWVYDPAARQPALRLSPDDGSKWSGGLAWEPAHLEVPCRRLASGHRNRCVYVWDVATGRRLKQADAVHAGHVLDVGWGGEACIYTVAELMQQW